MTIPKYYRFNELEVDGTDTPLDKSIVTVDSVYEEDDQIFYIVLDNRSYVHIINEENLTQPEEWKVEI